MNPLMSQQSMVMRPVQPMPRTMVCLKNLVGVDSVSWPRNTRSSLQLEKSKQRQVRRSTVYKFGYEVPRNHTDALRLDEKSGSGKQVEFEGIELAQIDEYDTFLAR